MPTTLQASRRVAGRTVATSGLPIRAAKLDRLNRQARKDGAGTKATPAPRSALALKAENLREEVLTLRQELQAKLHQLNAIGLPELVLPELHDGKTGRIDAQKVADFMGVPLKRLSDGLGLYYKAVHRNPAAVGFQKALRPVKKSLELLHEFFGPAEAIRAWLNTPHPDLDGTTALETILEGKAEAVALILENAAQGIPV